QVEDRDGAAGRVDGDELAAVRRDRERMDVSALEVHVVERRVDAGVDAANEELRGDQQSEGERQCRGEHWKTAHGGSSLLVVAARCSYITRTAGGSGIIARRGWRNRPRSSIVARPRSPRPDGAPGLTEPQGKLPSPSDFLAHELVED